jgi:RHS repeat-associated protein
VLTRRTNGTTATFYMHRDHLGSPELITNASGGQLAKLSFAAYGARRDTDWDGPISSANLTTLGNTTRHGFTDHEHLDSVGLIHMNGRVYDPVIGRFLSRDPYIDGVGSSQGANGYAYVWNNPLTRLDPSGYKGEPGTIRNECNPDCPVNWRDGVGARLSNTFVSCYGNCSTQAGYSNVSERGSWNDYAVTGYTGIGLIDGKWQQVTLVQSKQSVWVPLGPNQDWGGGGFAWGRTVLDIVAASEVPVLSQGAGLGSAVLSAWDGDWTGFGLSIAGLGPGMVWADAAKAARTAEKIFSKEKQALVDMAKADKRNGITSADMQAYKDLNKGLPDPFPTNKVRGPEAHPTGAVHSQQPHGHVGPVNHIPIMDGGP